MTVVRPFEEEGRLEEKANLMKREKLRRRCICNANTGPTLPAGRKMKGSKQAGTKSSVPSLSLIRFQIPRRPPDSPARPESRFRRCEPRRKKKEWKILISPLLNCLGDSANRRHRDTSRMLITIEKPRFTAQHCQL